MYVILFLKLYYMFNSDYQRKRVYTLLSHEGFTFQGSRPYLGLRQRARSLILVRDVHRPEPER